MTEQITIPAECLQLISQKNKTGCLIVTDPKDRSIQWKLYVNQGQINYGTSLIGQQERLTYLGQILKTPLNIFNYDPEHTEYQEICNYWLTQKLPIIDLQQLCLKLTQETLVQVSALERTSITFLPNNQLQPTVLNYSLRDFFAQFQTAINHWKQLRTEISSPFIRLCLDSQKIFHFYKAWQIWSKEREFLSVFGTQTLSAWLQSLAQKKCLYEIATQMQVSPLTLALKLQPLVKTGAIQSFPFQEPILENIEATIQPEELPNKAIILSAKNVQPNNFTETKTIAPPVTVNNLRESNTIQKNTAIDIAEKIDTRTSALSSIIKRNDVPILPIASSSRPLIVCIDDSKTVQQQVTKTLEVAGYQTISITDPASALTVLIRHKPVLILLDINMPEINGYELCQMLSRSRKLKDIPVVMLTGREGLVDRLRAKFIGVSEYLTKPFNPNELIEVVQRLTIISCSI
ncbi:response regulator [Aphanothece hegewaldii]|nr:response regulator [Aphanothece hegewaldii]